VHEEAAEEAGLLVLASDIEVMRNFVELSVAVADGQALRSFEAKYGAGAINLEGALKPVDEKG
jgi:hypothetical protein